MYELVNNYSDNINLTKLEDFIKYCINELKLEEALFNVIVINNNSIKDINREYRNIDKETDVISFALNDTEDICPINVLGDIYISYDKVIEQSKEYNHSIDREICFLFIHGLLHLLGYDHINKEEEIVMVEKQEMILDVYGLKRDAKKENGV